MAKTYGVNEIFMAPQGEGVRVGTINVFVRFQGCNLQCSSDGEAGFDCDTDFVSGRKMTLIELWEATLKTGGPTIPMESTVGKNKYLGRQAWLIPACKWLVLTGGEPGLQVDDEFCDFFHSLGMKLAIETNGTVKLPTYDSTPDLLSLGDINPLIDTIKMRELGIDDEDSMKIVLERFKLDWITVSPKSAEHTIRQSVAHEVKYVRNADQSIPKPRCKSLHRLLSPAFDTGVHQPDGTTVWRSAPGAVQKCIDLCVQHPEWRVSPQFHKVWRTR